MTSARVHPFRAGLSRYYSALARRRDPLERVRNARDALPQRARTVRVGSDARDRPPYWCATWPAIWCWKEQKERHLPTYFYHSFPEHDASSDVRHVALNTAFDTDSKRECIAGGVPWSLVRPQPCSSLPPREAQTRLDSVRDQPPQSRRLVVAIESDLAETRSERESSVARCRELPRDREGRRRPSL